MAKTTPKYADYLDLIRSEAWKRVRRNPLVDMEDVMAAGNLAFAEAVQTWDPAKGTFSTHLVWRLRHRLGQVQGCSHYALDEIDALEVIDPSPDPYNVTKFRAGLASLSREALEVVWLILRATEEVTDWTMQMNLGPTTRSVGDYLHDTLGWPRRRVVQAYREIREMLRNL